jgi:hypothetical protein
MMHSFTYFWRIFAETSFIWPKIGGKVAQNGRIWPEMDEVRPNQSKFVQCWVKSSAKFLPKFNCEGFG